MSLFVNNKEEIVTYLDIINRYKEKNEVKIEAYCIMNNHAHLLIKTDEIRELSGTTGKIGIEDMTTDIGAANIEITEQAVLIAQIITTIEDLPEASEGEIELPTLNNAGSASDLLEGK